MLSPELFKVIMADLEKDMEMVRQAVVKLMGERICTLSYADDVILLAEEEGEMRRV